MAEQETRAAEEAKATPDTRQNFSISLSCEATAVASNEKRSQLLAMASLRAPTVGKPDKPQRAPIDLVAVVDVSGSMYGTKLELVQSALRFVLSVLTPTDRFGLVSFDSDVRVPAPLSLVTKDITASLESAVHSLRAKGATNLSGGILEGISLLERGAIRNVPSATADGESITSTELPASMGVEATMAHSNQQDKVKHNTPSNASVASIILFTDGQATSGITEGHTLCEAVKKALVQVPHAVSIFSFGFGDDHDAEILRQIATSGSGMYYFVENEEKIPGSFGDCLGGITSVAAQNLKLHIDANGEGQQVVDIQVHYPTTINSPQSRTIRLGDIYSEEQRDILFTISIPEIPQTVREYEIARVRLVLFNVITCEFEEIREVLYIERGSENRAADLTGLSMLDQQKNRLLAVKAMKEAGEALAQRRNADAQMILQAAMDHILASPSAGKDLSKAIMDDLQRSLNSIQNSASSAMREFASTGDAYGRQRSTFTAAVYRTPQKMKQFYDSQDWAKRTKKDDP